MKDPSHKDIFFADSGHREKNTSPGGQLERWANMFDLTSANVGAFIIEKISRKSSSFYLLSFCSIHSLKKKNHEFFRIF